MADANWREECFVLQGQIDNFDVNLEQIRMIERAKLAEKDALLSDALTALDASYSILGMLPAADMWNAADAADFFDGTYGIKMRQKFDDAWLKVAAVLARGKEGK